MIQCASVFVVEDDPDILQLIRECLVTANFQVNSEQSGAAGLQSILKSNPDVVVLDLNLPDMDGLSVCRELRKTSALPVLILSSQGDELDKVIGLEVGADDYMAKPFHPRELVARVRALIRRKEGFPNSDDAKELESGSIRIDQVAHCAWFKEEQLHLTKIEFGLLKALASRPGQVFTRQTLLDLVWGSDYVGGERLVDVHIRNLRGKLGKHNESERLLSVRGVGYRWVE